MHALAKRAAEYAASKGFDAPTWANLPGKLMLVVTELDEVVDAAERCSQAVVVDELADTAIRILGILHGWRGDEWFDRSVGRSVPARCYERPEVLLWPIIERLCAAISYWRNGLDRDVQTCLELAARETFEAAHRFGVGDIGSRCWGVLVANAGRPHLHGKVESLG